MSAFVEECRREWKRLGVPDVLAEEMATELEADLADAEADGVSAAELLGESDPRRFAETWASERGLVAEQPPEKRRKRPWIWIAVAVVVLVLVLVPLAAGLAFGVGSASIASVEAPQPVRTAHVPQLVGLNSCHAYRIAAARHFDLGFRLTRKTMSGCRSSIVVHQRPQAYAIVPRHSRLLLRAREGPVRVPNLVGRSECTAENVLARLGLHVRHYPTAAERARNGCRRIVSQIPAAGRMLLPPHAVTVRLRPTTS
jgi:hypothetical protein